MRSLKNTLTVCLLSFSAAVIAQTTLPVPRNIQAAFDKGTRSTLGIPGKNYWQNFASYEIQVRFEPATRLITGTEDITYTNNSPDTLREIVFKLYPNLYQQGAPRMIKIDPTDINAGVQISRFLIDGKILPDSSLLIDATNMRVPISPLFPKQSIHFTIAYNYTLNKGTHKYIRTGEIDNGAWFLAYFFPRIAVYDDLDGWNMHPYLSSGPQEFYNDFCNFKFGITVPKGCVVWATGDLQNCAEVLAPQYCQRLATAEKSDGIYSIIDSIDLKTGNITANHPENTFRFEANNITDVAVAISNHYLWKSTSVVVDSVTRRRTRVDAVYNAQHQEFIEVIDFARKTVESMSFKFPIWPFPYSHMTVFNGLSEMEYPMMVNDLPLTNRAETIDLTIHEIFHTMFPFYMGTNETKYGWMDEGWATLSSWIITPMIDSTLINDWSINIYEQRAGLETDLPAITLSTQQYAMTLFTNSYPKPALAFLYAKDFLGDDLFYKGLHQFIRDWNGKHPMPYDFFNSMNVGSGVNLDWFWKRWFFDTGAPDLAISKFIGAKEEKIIIVEMKGDKPVPIELTVLFTDGSVQKIHRSADVWEHGNNTVDIRFSTGKTVKEISLGSNYVPDVNKKDNYLMVKE